MPGFSLLVIAGIVVGLVVRHIIADNGYGPAADVLLGIVGAFAAGWAMGQSELGWTWRVNFTIWAAAALPYLAHRLTRGRTRIAGRQARQQRASK
jgi:uncharacterized membrane protein YeaQ/YmgE (transglycosylase-associated protein family)